MQQYPVNIEQRATAAPAEDEGIGWGKVVLGAAAVTAAFFAGDSILEWASEQFSELSKLGLSERADAFADTLEKQLTELGKATDADTVKEITESIKETIADVSPSDGGDGSSRLEELVNSVIENKENIGEVLKELPDIAKEAYENNYENWAAYLSEKAAAGAEYLGSDGKIAELAKEYWLAAAASMGLVGAGAVAVDGYNSANDGNKGQEEKNLGADEGKRPVGPNSARILAERRRAEELLRRNESIGNAI